MKERKLTPANFSHATDKMSFFFKNLEKQKWIEREGVDHKNKKK